MNAQAHEIQGSESWLAYRKTRGGASEIAALLGFSPYFPRTPFELWQTKTGRAEVYVNSAMTRGNQLEAAARSYMEAHLGEVFEPQVVEDGRIVASLDGQSFEGSAILEIKIPAAGRDSDLWKYVEQHRAPPEHYLAQAQQQLAVSGAVDCIFAVCHADGDEITDHVECLVRPDLDMHKRIRAAWAGFFSYLDADHPPPMTERDVIERSDPDWAEAAQAYRMAKAALKNAESAEKSARDRLQALAGDQSTKGCGVSATRYVVAGSVDYKAALPKDIDLEQYRKPARLQWRITEAKE